MRITKSSCHEIFVEFSLFTSSQIWTSNSNAANARAASAYLRLSAFDHGLEELYRLLGSDCRKLAKSQDVWWQLWYDTVVQML